jgi:hypothetical protein
LATNDSAGGAIVLWMDTRNGVYAQRVDASGVPRWTEDGVLLCDSTGHTHNFAATDDGRQGAIAVWGPYGSQLAVQRVSAEGVPLWGSNGLVLRPGIVGLVEYPALVRDGHGGAIVVWDAHPIDPSAPDTLIACGVDSGGTKLWEVVVCIDTIMWLDAPSVCPDGLGGVVVTWPEYDGSTGRAAARAQRIDSAGAIKWYASGVPLCTLATMQHSTGCVEVGGSRLVASWLDGDGDSLRHRAQMLDLAGNRVWGPAGVPLSGGVNSSSAATGLPTVCAKQSVWVWEENRSGTDHIFVQKLDSSGMRCWDTSGVWVGTTDTANGFPFSATVDGRGGTIVAWPLHRSGLNWDIYAQHIDSAGNLSWSDAGLAVCEDTNNQKWTPGVVTDGDGGAIVAWLSYQDVYACRIYAQRVADGAAVEETVNDECRAMNSILSVTRGVLFLPEAASLKPQASSLMDATGRRVLELRPGANDARGLAPGVYFVCEGPRASSRRPLVVRKVIITG